MSEFVNKQQKLQQEQDIFTDNNDEHQEQNILDKINSALDTFYAFIGDENDSFIPTDPTMKPIILQSVQENQSVLEQYFSKIFRGYYNIRFNIGLIRGDMPYYSPIVYEAMVHDLTIQAQIQVKVDLDLEFLRFFRMRPQFKFNFANIGAGIEAFLNTNTWDEMCTMMYYNYEVLALHTKLRTNMKTCQYSLLDRIRYPNSNSFVKNMDCKYFHGTEEKIDLGDNAQWTLFPNLQIREYPVTGCLF